MTFTYAGEYAGDILYRTAGAAAGVQVAVTTSGNAPATLYTDATKDTPLGTNVVTTDSLGNLAFFADPGTYTCTANGSSFPVVLAVNPLESGGGGSGSVTSVAVESANGLSGTVADATTTPQITLATTATGVLKGASGVIGAATAGTDYLAPSGSGASLTGITAAQAGADASGAAATAQSNAETFATSAVAAETSRAEAAEALLAPKASPALTGTPVAPTASALTDSTQIATTAYADSAAGVEKTRAEGAESANASAISAETSRAEAAEALKAPLASPALTGTPTAPTASALTDSTQLATTAYADSAVGAETARAEAAETGLGTAFLTKARKSFYAYEDFINNVNTSQILSGAQNSGSVSIATADAASSAGLSQLNTNANTAGGAAQSSSGFAGSFFDLSAVWQFEARVKIPTLSNGTDTFQVWAGFLDTLYAESSDGAYFSYIHTEDSGDWVCVASKGATRARADSTVAVAAGSWYVLKVIVASVSGTLTATYYVNDTQIGTSTTDIPNTTSNVFGYGVDIVKSAGTTSRTVVVDYIEVSGYFSGKR